MKQFYFKITLACVVLFLSCNKDNNDVALSIEEEIHQLINNHRESMGLQPLKNNATAYKLAKDHNTYMINAQIISHDNFNKRITHLQNNENAIFIGENVAANFNTAEEVVAAWLDSPGHRKNIEEDFTHTGIAASKDNAGHYYFTQIFFRK
ncbi:MAG: hypothetical protein CR985_02570 [Flavobacteriales bacterium]|nr:MAG: hypothetical protein CR985_02570 [Flavobacteriales bacterium]